MNSLSDLIRSSLMDGHGGFVPPLTAREKMSFESLGLHEALTRAVADSGYATATDVQTQAIPPAIEGRDLMVSASTGSGTASRSAPRAAT